MWCSFVYDRGLFVDGGLVPVVFDCEALVADLEKDADAGRLRNYTGICYSRTREAAARKADHTLRDELRD